MNKVTKEDFEAYEEVRQSGVTNMFDVHKVKQLSGLTREQIVEIMQTYADLMKEFPEDKYCIFNCGRILDADLDHENSCRYCE